MTGKLLHRLKVLGVLMRRSFTELQKNDPLRMAGATAFFTTFALPAILIILIRIFGLFINRHKFVTSLFERLSGMLDASSVLQVKQTLRNFRSLNQHGYLAVIAFLFFIFVATTLFNVLKNSVDQIWKIGLKKRAGFVYSLKLRFKSLVIIILAGMLLFLGLLTEGIRAFFGGYTRNTWPTAGKLLNIAGNELFFIVVVTVWFSVLFRMLASGRPAWKAAFGGGLLTAVLFTLGKYLVRSLLATSNIGLIYGASGSVVLIMLFVFYSSFIFYYGACFIKVLSMHLHTPIQPVPGAFNYEMQEIMRT